jgi:hypothetical protein
VIRSFSRAGFQAALFLAVVSAALGFSSVAGAQDITYSLQNRFHCKHQQHAGRYLRLCCDHRTLFGKKATG